NNAYLGNTQDAMTYGLSFTDSLNKEHLYCSPNPILHSHILSDSLNNIHLGESQVSMS
ncbi:hypothetical protein P7K49_039606, partial [Saguinus oedipus]